MQKITFDIIKTNLNCKVNNLLNLICYTWKHDIPSGTEENKLATY